MIADLLGNLHEARSPRIVLILRPQDQVPEWVNKVIQMGEKEAQEPAFIGSIDKWQDSSKETSATTKASSSKARRASDQAPESFSLSDADVKYHDRHVLKGITWQLRAGDRAVLTGANGERKLPY